MDGTIQSRDGTRIAFWRTGSGPPLVLVHGTTADHGRWAPVLARLAEQLTVYAIDRRGRGGSGDAADYALEREVEDVAAVVDSIGAPTSLLGHSYGAICSLEASLRTSRLRKLVLYEPPIPQAGPRAPPGSIARLEALLARGEREAVVTTFFRENVHMPPRELELLRSLPNWPERVAAAHTLPRELRAGEAYALRPERFARLTTPTLLLLGGDSPPFFRQATDAVSRALPRARLVLLPGQQHAAMNTAPEPFVREVLGFLLEQAVPGDLST